MFEVIEIFTDPGLLRVWEFQNLSWFYFGTWEARGIFIPSYTSADGFIFAAIIENTLHANYPGNLFGIFRYGSSNQCSSVTMDIHT